MDDAVTYKEMALTAVNAIGVSTVQDYLKTDKNLSEQELLKFATDRGIVKSTSEIFATTTDAETAAKTAVALYINKPFIEKKQIELNDDIVDLIDKQITFADNSFTYDKADELKVGDIILLPPTEEYIGGVAQKVESISGNTIHTVTPKMEEVYETLQISSVAVPDLSDIKAATDGVTFENNSGIELALAESQPRATPLALASKNNGDVRLLGDQGTSINLNINITKGKISLDEKWNSFGSSISDKSDEEELNKIEKDPKFKYDKSGNMYTSKYKGGYEIKGKISISDLSFTSEVDYGLFKGLKKAETKANFKASVDLSIKGKINETIDVFSAKIPLGVGVWIDAMFSLVFDANGDISVKCTLENTTTYTYEKGTKTANDTKLNNQAGIAGNVSAKVGPRAILVFLGIDLFDIRAMIGLAARSEVSATQGTSEIPCVDVKVYAPTVSIGFAEDKNTLVNQLGFSFTWKVYDLDGAWQKPLTTLTYHYEAGKGWVKQCTHPEKIGKKSTTTASRQPRPTKQSTKPSASNPTAPKKTEQQQAGTTSKRTEQQQVATTSKKTEQQQTTTTITPTVQENPASDFEYEIYNGGVIIKKYVGTSTKVVIPAKINGKSVMRVGDRAFGDCIKLTSIAIPDGVTHIGWMTFTGCTALTDVVIPDSIISIGDGAFSKCNSLTNIIIPDSVTSIGGSAFSGCSNLQSVTIPNSVMSISGHTFAGCTGLIDVTIGNGVTSIGDYAFSQCSSLKRVAIPSNVTNIGYWTFQYCSGLTSVIIPDSVTSIGPYAFFECDNLKTGYFQSETQKNKFGHLFPNAQLVIQ